ncbi:beta-lactamase family protein [Ectobacillus sp. JY-23]|uniref:serine hydrolase domain-containing protein n=1 Tax=Ectobacillus sp. JY-23 TaxID=2933872 RepID=UPI001FF652B8|nr:serine hydrolase [Ectobacillus sp. JY-23]UOY92829.1 beta-lactamase family protein [Ectobacillus sp. JY-23]
MKILNATQMQQQVASHPEFSGVITIEQAGSTLFEHAQGYYNRSEGLRNTLQTRFGIASGCKLFTAIAICRLIEQDLLAFDTKLKDCLPIAFPHINGDLTIHHLLTHTSGIPDYFDEAIMSDFEDLWQEYPMYTLKRPSDFLPMFQHGRMMFEPGEQFHYNNAGFIVLGMIIEQVTGAPFSTYIEEHVLRRCDMFDSGYFSLDCLPKNTAFGYIDEDGGAWRTNIYSIPIQSGADGGAYVTAPDMTKFWRALLRYQILSEASTKLLLKPHVQVKEHVYYGYGIWMKIENKHVKKYHIMGYDPGVSFHSVVYPASQTILSVLSNKSSGAFQMMNIVEEQLQV